MAAAPAADGHKGAAERVLALVIPLIYARRWLTFAVLTMLSLYLGGQALQLQPDAGFEKQIPLEHPYMKVFKEYERAFGGANLISIALMQEGGKDIYNAEFLDRLKKLSDATFFLPGVDRTRVSSLFTPDLTYFEVVDGGINLGNVVPRNYEATPEMLAEVRRRVAKAGVIGRFVASGQDGAMIVAELLERHPVTGERLDYKRLADQLEDQLRQRISAKQMVEYRLKAARPPYAAGDVVWRGYTDYGWRLRFQRFEAEQKTPDGDALFVDGDEVTASLVANPDYAPGLSVHIIGFAKVVGDVTDASAEVIAYFFVAMALTLALLWWFCGSFRLALLPLTAGLVAVIWELGLLRLFGFGLDPFAILVPFLILSIGVSHGVQYVNGWANEVAEHGMDPLAASLQTFRRLAIPGTVAILTDVIGFATLAFIQIDIVREMAINAAMGMAAVIVTNKMLLPILLSWVRIDDLEGFKQRHHRRLGSGEPLWQRITVFATRRGAVPCLLVCLVALGWALHMYPKLTVGDAQAGVPELRPDSRYNRDSATVVGNFAIGVDILKVIAETGEYGCLDHRAMESIDELVWRLRNTEGVASALALPTVAREVRGLWNENAPAWKVLPRNRDAMAQLVGRIPSSSGLQNLDCSRMPLLVFTADHRAETLDRVLAVVQDYEATEAPGSGVSYQLASGNVGVMAATNEEIRAREIVVIVWVHLTLLIFVWLSFRSLAAVICIITPLVLCSLLTYGFMATIGVGMKAATLPVAAFGVGIGVDDGIYLWGVFAHYLGQGLSLRDAYAQALRSTGKAVLFTSLTLIVAVAMWLFSGLQFQADMGLLLVTMFSANLLGALLMLPALAWLCAKFLTMKPSGGITIQ
ncbi:MAG: efflux RND transporter permease subunit [Stagnimonas sp.]|nr:efflux RND transporter permease subunit [Stagnimonas sp.]